MVLADLHSGHNDPQAMSSYDATVRIRALASTALTNRSIPADTTVKVPQMAESISEGTLKQWSKSASSLHIARAQILTCDAEVGDYVERDEEIATIETDKVGSVDDSAPSIVVAKVYHVLDRRGRQCAGSRDHQGISGQRGRHGHGGTRSGEAGDGRLSTGGRKQLGDGQTRT